MKIKRILMLTDPGIDLLAYMMFNGLYKILGKDNLCIYPDVKHYHGGVDEYILDDGRKWYAIPPACMGIHDISILKSFDELVGNDIRSNIGSFDIIYLPSGRTYVIKILDELIARCGRNNLPPIVFSEGEDYQDLVTIRMIKKKYNPIVCFKRELVQSELGKGGDLCPIYPLPFSAIADNIIPDNPNKDIDVFAIFTNTFKIREDIVRLIDSRLSLSGKEKEKYKIYVKTDRFSNDPPSKHEWDSKSRFDIPPLMPYSKYLDYMSRAKINIVARGWGYDTIRRFETLTYSGLVMSDVIPNITPDPFIDKEHIVYYNNDLSNLIELIEYYLDNSSEKERERIGKNGREHCMRYHTTEARAKYFLSRIEGHI